ncbi:MAG: ribosome maturation factor RimM [Alphaproteobacteria bacterium]
MAKPGRDPRVCLGAFAGAHGVRGLVRVRPYTEVPEDVGAYGPVESEDGRRVMELTVKGRGPRGHVLAAVRGVADRDAAEALSGLRFYVARDRLPAPAEEEFYHADLIGLAVEDEAGHALGTVRAVHEYGGGTALEIAGPDGTVATVPFSRAAVPTVDLAAGRLVVAAAQVLAAGAAREAGQ